MRLIVLLLTLANSVCLGQIFVPAGGNSWMRNDLTGTTAVSTTYVWLSPGSLNVSIVAETGQSTSANVTILFDSKPIEQQAGKKEHVAGTWTIVSEGYLTIVIAGLTTKDFSGLQLSGTSVTETAAFVKNNEGNFFYWGQRGPSVHLRYDLPGKADIEWFYSEITVPENNDVIGSYYMANGFADGYFGFQVNSETERRILFSVWSPFKTDDPKAIPEEERIILMKKGDGVYTGEFGNEGSGGQSYWRYPWKAGTTYGFLLRAQPEGPNTVYTSWFYAPETKQWKLIASWRRPKKATYLTALYSFLENFIPETGNVERRALYSNQWIRDTSGTWTELTQIKFTGDNTARKNYRKDYGGGVSGDSFFLRNCGFFSDFTPLDQTFTRRAVKKQPTIDFTSLP